jgi:ectoine hydroxylase-related dioxygenase (phytanoyl-CoA dioxygenase family)
MHFASEQIEFYRAKGYIAGPRVLSDEEIAALKRRIDDILTGKVPFPDHLLGETTTKSRAKGQLPSVKIVNLFRHDGLFREVLDNRVIGTLAHDLMEGPVRVWEDQMIYKPPFDGTAAVAWHQDYTYWTQVGPPELATCWIALDDATVANGCMHVIPGSHRWNFRYSREEVDPANPNWLLQHPDLPADAVRTPIPCEVKAGCCHFHHCLTFHGSFGNTTNNLRRSYILHLMPGYTRRIGNSWNERQGRVEEVGIGEIVRGPSYPELVAQL